MYNSNPEPMTTLAIRIPVWLKEQLIAYAAEKRRSVSDVVRAAVEQTCIIDTKRGGE